MYVAFTWHMARESKKLKTVLILENDNDLANSIRLFLEDTYRVYIIQDASKLIQYLKKFKINLLVTDVDIPHPDFEKFLHFTKNNHPNLKIILMYMFLDEKEHKGKSILNKADDHIFKPFDADLLKKKLDRLAAVPISQNIQI